MFTYDPTLPTDRDHVRLLINDTVESSAKFSDEELTALIAEETSTGKARKYFAAARALEILIGRWAGAGDGVAEIQVDDYRAKAGLNENSIEGLHATIASLRKRGAWLLSSSCRPFRALPRSTS